MTQKLRENEFVVLLVDTGAIGHVCEPLDLMTHAALTSGPPPALGTTTGELLKHYGMRIENFRCRVE